MAWQAPSDCGPKRLRGSCVNRRYEVAMSCDDIRAWAPPQGARTTSPGATTKDGKSMNYRSLEEGWLPLDEAATAVDYRASTVRRLAGDGEIEAEKIRHVWVVYVPDLRGYKQGRTVGRPRELQAEEKGVNSMTWAERVGDLAIGVTIAVLTLFRIVTELLRLLLLTLDRFVMDLSDLSEEGLQRTKAVEKAWVRLPGSVLLEIALLILQFLTIFTVLFREAATKLNDFVTRLAEGEGQMSSTGSSVE